ncbi:hypothetical protein ACRRTK_011231 [Alexandromys fortis]
MAVVIHFGDPFTVIRQVALERNPYEGMHYWAFYVGISLAGLLSLGAVLSTIATVREAHGLMAAGFLCFALSFCVLVQVAFWRFHNPTQDTGLGRHPRPLFPGMLLVQVEDAVLDTYDLVYDQAMKSPSSSWWQELATIQDTFLCCGKKSPFGFLASTRAIPCQGQEAMREVYAMMLCAFLWFAIHSYCGLDRKGRYTLTPRYVVTCAQSGRYGLRRKPFGKPMAASPRNPASSDGPKTECLNAPLKHKHLLTIRHPSEARVFADHRV